MKMTMAMLRLRSLHRLSSSEANWLFSRKATALLYRPCTYFYLAGFYYFISTYDKGQSLVIASFDWRHFERLNADVASSLYKATKSLFSRQCPHHINTMNINAASTTPLGHCSAHQWSIMFTATDGRPFLSSSRCDDMIGICKHPCHISASPIRRFRRLYIYHSPIFTLS